MAILRGEGPSDGWLFSVDSFAFIPELGNWAVYAEKASEAAVVGFHKGKHNSRLVDLFNLNLGARAIRSAFAEPISYVFSERGYTDEWHSRLMSNY